MSYFWYHIIIDTIIILIPLLCIIFDTIFSLPLLDELSKQVIFQSYSRTIGHSRISWWFYGNTNCLLCKMSPWREQMLHYIIRGFKTFMVPLYLPPLKRASQGNLKLIDAIWLAYCYFWGLLQKRNYANGCQAAATALTLEMHYNLFLRNTYLEQIELSAICRAMSLPADGPLWTDKYY